MKKGFTLIELLAVIVILALIATITIPIVIDIVVDVKNSSLVKSAKSYIDAVEHAINNKNVLEEFNPTTCVVKNDGNIICDGIILEIEVKKNIPISGKIKIKDGVVESVENLKIGNNLLSTDSNKEFILQ